MCVVRLGIPVSVSLRKTRSIYLSGFIKWTNPETMLLAATGSDCPSSRKSWNCMAGIYHAKRDRQRHNVYHHLASFTTGLNCINFCFAFTFRLNCITDPNKTTEDYYSDYERYLIDLGRYIKFFKEVFLSTVGIVMNISE